MIFCATKKEKALPIDQNCEMQHIGEQALVSEMSQCENTGILEAMKHSV